MSLRRRLRRQDQRTLDKVKNELIHLIKSYQNPVESHFKIFDKTGELEQKRIDGYHNKWISILNRYGLRKDNKETPYDILFLKSIGKA